MKKLFLIFLSIAFSINLWGQVISNFNYSTTPLSNFVGYTSYVIVEGNSIPMPSINRITFNNSYEMTTTLPASFLQNFSNIIDIDISSMINLQTINRAGFSNCAKLQRINLPMSITSFEAGVLSYAMQLKHLKLPTSLTSWAVQVLFYTSSLESIDISNIDIDNITVIGTDSFFGNSNTSSCKIYCTNQQLGENFKNKFPYLSNWTVVVGTPPNN